MGLFCTCERPHKNIEMCAKCKYVVVEICAMTLRIEELEKAIRDWAAAEPPCHCGELAPGPCCHACHYDRKLRELVQEKK